MTAHSENKILIIGAGLGGLLCGAILSKEGFEVTIVEKNKQIGGNLQSFGLDGKLFEAAVHYIGSMSPNQTLFKIFDYIGLLDKLSLQMLDENCFDKIILKDSEFSLAQGHQNFIHKLSEKFPSEEKNLHNFVNEIKNVCTHFPLYNLRNGNNEEKKRVINAGLAEKINALFTNEKLKQVLGGNNLLFAGDYATTPFYLYALIQNSYIEGSWKFKNGSSQLAKLLEKQITTFGGKILRNIDIKTIHEKDGKINYVSTSNGEKYFAHHFISNLHPHITYSLLDSNIIKPITKKRIATTENTLSAFMVNISLKENTVAYQNYNTYFHLTEDVWKDLSINKNNEPNSYGIFMNQNKQNPLFATSLSILTYMNIMDVPFGENTINSTSNKTNRGEKYEHWKQQTIAKIIKNVVPILPTLKNAIQKIDACTPLSYRDYLNIPNGSMYGFKKNVTDLANTTYSTRTKIENLHLTGQNINLHGVLGVSITSILTVSEFVGLDYLVNKINKKS